MGVPLFDIFLIIINKISQNYSINSCIIKAYTMIDVDSEVPDGVVEELKQIGEVLRVRVIC